MMKYFVIVIVLVLQLLSGCSKSSDSYVPIDDGGIESPQDGTGGDTSGDEDGDESGDQGDLSPQDEFTYLVTSSESLSGLINQSSTQVLLVTMDVTDQNTQTTETRQFVVHYPAIETDTQLETVVFDFHGSGRSTISQVYNGLVLQYSAKAANSSIVFVYPFGTLAMQSSGSATLSWNLGGSVIVEGISDDPPTESEANDIIFIKAIYDYLQIDFPYANRIAATQVIGIGSSQGSAFLLNRLLPQVDFLTGVCGKVSQLFDSTDQGYVNGNTNRYKVLYFYGYNDPYIPYLGGESSVGHRFLSVQESIEQWRARNGLDDTVTESYFTSHQPQNQPLPSGSYTVDTVPIDIFYAYEDDDYPIHVYQHNRGHGLPNFIDGRPTLDIIWEFFGI